MLIMYACLIMIELLFFKITFVFSQFIFNDFYFLKFKNNKKIKVILKKTRK